MTKEFLSLFGGDLPWSPVDWTDSDDRVRGGKSQSYLAANAFDSIAKFYGNLDIETLGGAGFASQHTTAEKKTWDLHDYEGIALDIVTDRADSSCYTFVLKDSILEPDPDTGRDQASTSWEYDFTVPASRESVALEKSSPESTLSGTAREPPLTTQIHTRTLRIPFSALTPTYRGKPQPDTKNLNVHAIARFSLMNRSFFGSQSGPFSLRLRSIAAYRGKPKGHVDVFLSSRFAQPVTLLLGTAIFMTALFWVVDKSMR